MRRDCEAAVMLIFTLEHVTDELSILDTFVEIRQALVRSFLCAGDDDCPFHRSNRLLV